MHLQIRACRVKRHANNEPLIVVRKDLQPVGQKRTSSWFVGVVLQCVASSQGSGFVLHNGNFFLEYIFISDLKLEKRPPPPGDVSFQSQSQSPEQGLSGSMFGQDVI
jgi:hypothetical protein